MKKYIAIMLFISMTLSFIGCKKTYGSGMNSDSGRDKMSFEEKYNETTFDGYPIHELCLRSSYVYKEDFLDMFLNDPNAFAIKVTPTEKYEIKLKYEMGYADSKIEILKKNGGEFFEKDGGFYSECVSLNSYMLTDVRVDKIYSSNGNLDFKEGDIIPMTETAYIYKNSYKYIDEGEYKFYFQNSIKMYPKKEYFIIGTKATGEVAKDFEKPFYTKSRMGLFELLLVNFRLDYEIQQDVTTKLDIDEYEKKSFKELVYALSDFQGRKSVKTTDDQNLLTYSKNMAKSCEVSNYSYDPYGVLSKDGEKQA